MHNDDQAGIVPYAIGTGDFAPNSLDNILSVEQDTAHPLSIDYSGNLKSRSQVITDEGGFRTDFDGTSVFTELSGTCSFTNGSKTVIGSGTSFLSEVDLDDYVGKSLITTEYFERVARVCSDTELELDEPYTGSTGTATGYKSQWKVYNSNALGTTINGSKLSMNIGASSGAYLAIYRSADYLPIVVSANICITDRRTNQLVAWGFTDTLSTPVSQALVIFDGYNSTSIKFRTSTDSSYILETTVILPDGATTDGYLDYRIAIRPEVATLRVGGKIVAQHTIHIPSPYTELYAGAIIYNTGVPSGNTILCIDEMLIYSFDSLETVARQGNPNSVPNAWPIKVTDGIGTAAILEQNDGYDAPVVSRLAVNIGSPEVGIRGVATVVIGQKIPIDFANYLLRFVTDGSGNSDLNVNGSVTPKVYTYPADATADIELSEVRVSVTCQDITMDGNSFCSSPKLTNGVLIEVVSDGVTYSVYNIKQNEDWLFFNSPTGLLLNNTGPKDVMQAGFYFGGILLLRAGTSDMVRVTIRDNLTGQQMPNFFKVAVYGIKV
jgi:hypothetical protein